MKEITIYDLERLAAGYPPNQVSSDWDVDYVVEKLSRWILNFVGAITIDEAKIALEKANNNEEE